MAGRLLLFGLNEGGVNEGRKREGSFAMCAVWAADPHPGLVLRTNNSASLGPAGDVMTVHEASDMASAVYNMAP